ncbi:MAG TPA: response regulator [Chloroflexota bacterium]|jgi:CheY-like chemotaxis protein|nr:response regulator [Chloroflexota bacterium]
MTRILLVEDNDGIREMLASRLEGRGYEVLTAADGQQAVDRAAADAPDVVLMDLSLPVMDGWDATRTLKSSEQTRHIPIIALTAHVLEGERKASLLAHADEYEAKPVNFPQLLSKIQAFVTKQDQ